ncbi:GIY-YIG nuclease family protein [Streptomyces albogriseolus]|uniref:GIY-YIG nuclease family protein n=1 Tax=Streptomyces albogriseolus TaxID=1887 RepID=UPI003CEA8973
MVGKQVRLFLVDGTPGGLFTAEIMNWTGHVLKGKREKLGEIRTRPEARRTGVYILLGDDPDSVGDRIAYIGQSDDVANRLIHHDAKKDFWSEVVVITSKDTNLTSAHVRYLEARLIRLAMSIGRTSLVNGNEPTGGADLPEADASDMEYFIDQLRVLLPVLGIDMFRGRETRATAAGSESSPPPVPTTVQPTASPVFRFKRLKIGVNAQAQLIDGEFTVLAGSVVRAAMPDRDGFSESTARQYKIRQELHRKLLEDGSIVIGADGIARLTRDVVFSSPSAAGAIVQGSASINGREAWMTEDGTRFGEWESRDVQ